MKLDPNLFKLNEFELSDLLYLGRRALEARANNKYPVHTFEGRVLIVTFRFTEKGGFHVDNLERKK